MHLVTCALSLIFAVTIRSCSCDVLVYTQATNQVCHQLSAVKVNEFLSITKKKFLLHSQIIEEFQSLAARFGPSLPPNGFRVLAVGAEPAEACEPIADAPKANYSTQGISPKFVAVIVRGSCSFAGKDTHV